MVIKRAVIQWIPKEQGGRQSGPPSGVGPPHYSAPAKFLAYADTWSFEVFDLAIEKIECLEGPNQWLAEVHFRIEDAPHEWLVDGAEFELYEGKKCVARGRIEDGGRGKLGKSGHSGCPS